MERQQSFYLISLTHNDTLHLLRKPAPLTKYLPAVCPLQQGHHLSGASLKMGYTQPGINHCQGSMCQVDQTKPRLY